jgi:GNAT superfamily N-acetyltransferase
MPLLTDTRIRDARPDDHLAATTVLIDAFADGTVAAWAQPDAVTRSHQLRSYFTLLLTHAGTDGIIRLAYTPDTITGVAIWYPRPAAAGASDVHDLAPATDADGGGAASDRLTALEQALEARHPAAPHQYLAYLAVAPHRQNRGIGTALLTDHHRLLDRTRTPAYLEANDPRNRALYTRHGYTDLGPPVTIDGGPPVWPMWRHPHPAAPASAPAPVQR